MAGPVVYVAAATVPRGFMLSKTRQVVNKVPGDDDWGFVEAVL